MDAKFLTRIKQDYPTLKFTQGKRFSFRAPRTITIGPAEENDSLLLLHELGHALLNHQDFGTDVERLKMERAAWEKARELAPRYRIVFDDDLVENELDSYRDWLNKKSQCPKCHLTRFQTPDGKYHCPKCENFT